MIMLTFIAFAVVIAGCVNWLLIGLLQYDFVAGIFGYQGSIFSRLIYIVIGAGALFLVVKLFLDKGSIHIWGSKKKFKRAYATSDIEASKEDVEKKKLEQRKKESGYQDHDYDYDYEERLKREQTFFDEHLKRK